MEAIKAEVAGCKDIKKLQCVYSASAQQASQQIISLQFENEELKKKFAAATAAINSLPVDSKAVKTPPKSPCPKVSPVAAMTSFPGKSHVGASWVSPAWKRASLGTLNINASSSTRGQGGSSKKEGEDTRVCDGDDASASTASVAWIAPSGSSSSSSNCNRTGPSRETTCATAFALPVPTASMAANSGSTSRNKNDVSRIRSYGSSSSSCRTGSNAKNRVGSSCGVSGIKEKEASARGVGGRSVTGGAGCGTGVSREHQNKPSPALKARARPMWGEPRKVCVAAVTWGNVVRRAMTGNEEDTAERAVAEATRTTVHKGNESHVSRSGAKPAGSRLKSPTASSIAYTATRYKAFWSVTTM